MGRDKDERHWRLLLRIYQVRASNSFDTRARLCPRREYLASVDFLHFVDKCQKHGAVIVNFSRKDFTIYLFIEYGYDDDEGTILEVIRKNYK